MTGQGPEFEPTLVALFEIELETAIDAITRGLVCIEDSVADSDQIDRMMRAAHSIKGAARIVGIEPAVRVAHALEDFFASAQRSAEPVAKEAVDELLRAVDALGALRQGCRGDLAEWLATEGDSIVAAARRLASLVAGPVPARRAPSPAESPAARDADALPTPAVASAAAAGAPGTREVAQAWLRRADGEAAAPARQPHDRVVRLAAQSVQRLMGLAGESLVEARRLPEFAIELNRLNRRLGALAERLAELERLALERGVAALVEPARAAGAQLREDRRLLIDGIGRIERYGWRVDELSRRLYREALKSRMQPFRDGVVGLVRMVRDLARELGKQARLEIAGESTEVDRDVLEGLQAPITHLLRNALAHGVERPEERAAAGKPALGRLGLEARHHAGMLWIAVTDDGRGIDLEAVRARALERRLASEEILRSLSTSELLEFLFLPGFSTSRTLTEIAGRGVGLDAVRTAVEGLGGKIRVTSEPGRSTAFQLRLPVTRSVIRALLVEIAGDRYAFPLLRIAEILRLSSSEVASQEGRDLVVHRGESLALVSGAQLLGFDPAPEPGAELCVVVLEERGGRVGLLVDRFLGEQDLVVHPLDPRLGRVPGIAAGAILGNGMPALIPDVDDLFRSLERLPRERSVGRATPEPEARVGREGRVLVVEDSLTVREAERQLLENAGYQVETAGDGVDGWNRLRSGSFDLVITDVDMPEMNGIDLLRRIRGEERFRSLPVIIVSYKDRNEDKLRGLDAGATSYLTKSSFHDRSFIECVEDLIGPGGA